MLQQPDDTLETTICQTTHYSTKASKPVFLICAGIIAIVAMVGLARLSGFDPTQSAALKVVESRDILFKDTAMAVSASLTARLVANCANWRQAPTDFCGLP